MTFQHMKKNPSPLVHKLAKNLISYESRFCKICSVNEKRDLLLLGFLLTNLGFLRNFLSMKKKDSCFMILHARRGCMSVCKSACLYTCQLHLKNELCILTLQTILSVRSTRLPSYKHAHKLPEIILLVACYMTLQPALLVHPSVGPLVGQSVPRSIRRPVRPSVRPSVGPSVTLYFFLVFAVFGLTAPAQMIE